MVCFFLERFVVGLVTPAQNCVAAGGRFGEAHFGEPSSKGPEGLDGLYFWVQVWEFVEASRCCKGRGLLRPRRPSPSTAHQSP